MTTLHELQLTQGAALAPDGIPLHFGDVAAEYHAALQRAVLMDRSHEGRIELTGHDRFDLIQRMSTNDVLGIASGEGRSTIFTSPIGRILDRVTVYNQDDRALLVTEPGRAEGVRNYLQRNIFFRDEVQVNDVTDSTHQLALHGTQAQAVIDVFASEKGTVEVNGVPIIIAPRKPVIGTHWLIIVPREQAAYVWSALLEAGKAFGLVPAGSLTYNTLRIRAGHPAAGGELSEAYIPLEVGLWDEVSFTKGCYTGQEIIARMESRGRLAKTMVTLTLDIWIEAPAPLHHEGRHVGTLTSSVTTPDGEILGLGVVKVDVAAPGMDLTAGENATHARVTALAGAQPQPLAEEQS